MKELEEERLCANFFCKFGIITKLGEITEINLGFVFIIEITISVNVHIITLSVCGKTGL
jgi:hypothetical protein